MYKIDYQNGMELQFEGTLEEALKEAEETAGYTQENIVVTSDEERYISHWYGVPAEEDDEVIVDFGSFGFYGAWHAY